MIGSELGLMGIVAHNDAHQQVRVGSELTDRPASKGRTVADDRANNAPDLGLCRTDGRINFPWIVASWIVNLPFAAFGGFHDLPPAL